MRGHVRGQLDELADRIRFEPREHEHPRGRLASDLRDRQGQRVLGRQLDVAVGPHQEQGHVAQLACQEAEEEDGRRVGCLQVVEDHEQGLGACGVAQERRGRVEQLEARGLRSGVGWRREIREQVTQLGSATRS